MCHEHLVIALNGEVCDLREIRADLEQEVCISVPAATRKKKITDTEKSRQANPPPAAALQCAAENVTPLSR